MSIRPAVLAGQWYEGDAQKLRASIESYLASPQTAKLNAQQPQNRADPENLGKIRAIAVPHAGHVWSGPTAAAAYRLLRGAHFERIVILCPNHRVPVHGIAGVSADAFATPLGDVPVDAAMTEALRRENIIRIDDGAHRREHAVEIQLPFIQTVFGNGADAPKIVPLIVGDIGEEIAEKFAAFYRARMGGETLLIISTDFLHYGESYGYVPFGEPVAEQIEAYDARTVNAFSRLDAKAFEEFAQTYPHAACGINALRLASHIFAGAPVSVAQLAYDTSGRRSGDSGMSVSYVALAIADDNDKTRDDGDNPPSGKNAALNDSQQAAARSIVMRALAQAVSAGRETPMPVLNAAENAPPLSDRRGVFVTLRAADGNLRGCIGNILPVAPLAQSLWERAQDAALNDPRFDPVTPRELTSLSVEISVLTPPAPVAGPEAVEIGKHGILLKKGFRSAVFLPQVATEQGWDLETTLTHLSLKAGLPPDAWREGASFQVFEAQVF